MRLGKPGSQSEFTEWAGPKGVTHSHCAMLTVKFRLPRGACQPSCLEQAPCLPPLLGPMPCSLLSHISRPQVEQSFTTRAVGCCVSPALAKAPHSWAEGKAGGVPGCGCECEEL